MVLSGGTSNTNPNYSLGGPPSATMVQNDNLNNLFQNLTSTDLANGLVDYRCIYLFNDGDSTIYNMSFWIVEETPGGSGVNIGISAYNETQRVTVTGQPEGGSLTITCGDVTFTSAFNPDPVQWAADMQTQANIAFTADDIVPSDVQVTTQYLGAGQGYTFDFYFNGFNSHRSYPLFGIASNALTPKTTVSTSIIIQGSPINVGAPRVNVSTQAPAGINFLTPNPTAATALGLVILRPFDGFSLWFRRTTLPGTQPVENDGFTIRFRVYDSL